MGRLKKASVVAKTLYSGADTPGVGNREFYLYFADNAIKRFFVIQSHAGVQAYVAKDLEEEGNYWKATCFLTAAGPADYCDPTQTYEGAAWTPLFTAVPESLSRSTESNMAMPGSYKNQMGFLRAGMSWAGNAANKIMRIKLDNGKGVETDVWMDWFMWQFEMDWLSQCENVYWYSRYNRLADGTIPLKDLITGKVIPMGSGLIEQIQNKVSYSRLTYDFISQVIGDALYGMQDSNNLSITLHTGRGGLREFDRAMKEKGVALLTDWTGVADKFVTGTGRNLMLGGFFDGFYHIDGHTIRVKHNPVFDAGQVALAQKAGGYVHPETGWALESYRMVFIDDNDYDGQPNIQHVAQKGRSFLHGVVAGLTAGAPKSIQIMQGTFSNEVGAAASLATDIDQSSYTRMKSAGIQILRANRCFDLVCIAGL
jgi:hypothetical protein